MSIPARPPQRGAGGLGIAPEVALCALTLASVGALGRLFTDAGYLPRVALAAVASHALAGFLRRRGLGVGVSALLSIGALVVYLAWLVEPSTTAYGLPGPGFLRALRADLHDAWTQFGRVVAPVPPGTGFVAAAAAGAWWAAFVADWAAFRLGAAFEATVPPFTLFVFAAYLGTDRHAGLTTALFLAALLAFLLLHGAARRAEATAWFASRARGGAQSIVRGGAALAGATLLAALVVGPALPGADDPAIIERPGRGGNDGSRVTVSPLVDIRGRLVNQSDTEVFTVKATLRSYWRLTSLDTFDGAVWGSKGSYRDARGELALDRAIRAELDPAVQEFTITGLDGVPWLPAAYRPERYAGPAGVSFDRDSGSLLTEADSATGMVYRVRSVVPRFTGEELAGAPGQAPADVRERYTALPAGFPQQVAVLARQLTANAPTVYAKSLALQSFFRENFTYTLDVPPGHGDGAILRFLAGRRGYCEQFAGTFAAMARTLGIPARVAVGFTPGELQADGLYHVTGKQAHAWPEVFIDGYGWVAFEPTPGRGMPGAQGYTGVPEQQETAGGVEVTPTTQAPSTATTAPGGATPNTTPFRGEDQDFLSGGVPAGETAASPWPGRLRRAALAVLALGVLWVTALPASRWVRRRRRRARAADPSARTLVAWEETEEALALAGVVRREGETHAEYARRARTAAAIDDRIEVLARDADAAAYAPAGVDADAAARAESAAGAIGAAVRRSVSTPRRALWAVDPRTVLPRRRDRGR